MNTELSYLIDNATSCSARVVELVEADIPIVRLDRTLFHPKTGSQRADRGKIGSNMVIHVEFNNGVIDHYVDASGSMRHGTVVDVTIDEGWRRLQSAYHTAGHLIASAIEELRPDARNILGRHWPDCATLIWNSASDLSKNERQAVMERVDEYISMNLTSVITWKKGVRHVAFGSLRPMACNGTHLNHTSDLAVTRLLRTTFDGDQLNLQYTAIPR